MSKGVKIVPLDKTFQYDIIVPEQNPFRKKWSIGFPQFSKRNCLSISREHALPLGAGSAHCLRPQDNSGDFAKGLR